MNLHDRDIQRAARREGIAEGIEQGTRETAIKNAINFLKEGDSPEKVARCTELSLEEVQKLASELN